jgi:hypothetical protein
VIVNANDGMENEEEGKSSVENLRNRFNGTVSATPT